MVGGHAAVFVRSMAALLFGLLATAGCAEPSVAQTAEFYAGKRLIVLVNYDAGGPTDIEARVLARHLGRHIGGKPAVIVQNMGGAAGLIGTKYLGEIAPKDGGMMGYLTAATQRFVSAPERFAVDFRSYEFIAYSPSGRVHFVRTDVKPGVKTAADLMRVEGLVVGGLVVGGLVVGGLGPDAPKDMAMRLTLDMLGVRYRYVTGYNSSAQAMLAMQRGEISYYADSPPVYVGKIEPTLVRSGEVAPMFFDPGWDGTQFSTPRQMRALAIQPFQEFYRSVKGSMPSGPPSLRPWFQPKYSPVMTTPTPRAQMCSTPIGFLRACSLRKSRSSALSPPAGTCASDAISSTTRSSSPAPSSRSSFMPRPRYEHPTIGTRRRVRTVCGSVFAERR